MLYFSCPYFVINYIQFTIAEPCIDFLQPSLVVWVYFNLYNQAIIRYRSVPLLVMLARRLLTIMCYSSITYLVNSLYRLKLLRVRFLGHSALLLSTASIHLHIRANYGNLASLHCRLTNGIVRLLEFRWQTGLLYNKKGKKSNCLCSALATNSLNAGSAGLTCVLIPLRSLP